MEYDGNIKVWFLCSFSFFRCQVGFSEEENFVNDGLSTELSAVFDGRTMLFHTFKKGCLDVRFGNRSKKSTFRLCSALSGFSGLLFDPFGTTHQTPT